MATDTPWSTSYPTSQDTPGTEQPDLSDDSIPGAGDGDRALVSHVHTLRNKLQSVATAVGDDSNLPTSSLKAKMLGIVPENIPPASPSAYDEEFLDAALDAKWSWVGAGAPSGGVEDWDTGDGRLSAIVSTDGGGDDIGNDAHIIEQAIASLSLDWRVSMKIHLWNPNFNYSRFGLIIRNNADWNNLMLLSIGSGTHTRFWDKRDSGSWSYNSDATPVVDKGMSDYFILGIRHDQASTLFIPEYSIDGKLWLPTGSNLDYTTLGATPNRFGVNLWANTSTAGANPMAMVDWFRVEMLP